MERSRVQRFVVLPALAIGLLICLPATAWAQDVPPDTPPSTPLPSGPVGDQPRQDSDGNWRMDAGPVDPAGSTDVQAADAPEATGGPDDYGYAWNDGAAFNWIDATGGTDTGMSGYSRDQRVGPIPLPFSFKYYEGVYSNIYIAASGYVAFQDASEWNAQVRTPSAQLPNTVVSPYSTPLTLATKGKSGRVFYSSGGAAPNRYFVAAWNDVQYSGADDRYTFEVVLYENGDILFQYKTMTYGPDGSRVCGFVGIEDGEGLVGHQYSTCKMLSSGMAIRFTRPQPSGRVRPLPRGQGVFTRAGSSEFFRVTLFNNGELGTDTYKVTFSSTWPAQVLNAGGNPLADTDGDGAPDSGPVGQGGRVQLLVRVQTPAVAAVGDNNSAVLTVQSARTPGWQRQTTLRSAVPAPFAQAYEDVARWGVSVQFADPQTSRTNRLTQTPTGSEIAIAALPGGGHVVVWDQWENGNWYIRYLILDADGVPTGPVRSLQPSGGPLADAAYYLAVAVAPDGAIGIAWEQYESRKNGQIWEYRDNILWAVLDGTGKQVLAPTDLTGNTEFVPSGTPGTPYVYLPRIAAAGSSRFVLAWETEVSGEYWTENIFYTVRDTANGAIKAVTQLSRTTDLGRDDAEYPMLAGLTDGRVAVAYRNYRQKPEITLVVLTNAGEIAAGPVRFGPEYGLPQAMTQLSTGPLLALWVNWGASPYESELYYALLDSSTLAVTAGPTKLENPAGVTGDEYASVAAMADGRAIVSWSERDYYYRRAQYYALIGPDGALLTPPVTFLTARTPGDDTLPHIRTNLYSYAIAPNRAFDPTSTTLPDAAVAAPALSGGAPGGVAQLAIGVTNRGLLAAGSVVVTAELDSQLTYVGASPEPAVVAAAGTYPGAAGTVVHWDLPSLDYLTVGKIMLATGVPTATIGTTFPVTVTITHDGADFDDSNMTVQTQVMAAEQLFVPTARNSDD